MQQMFFFFFQAEDGIRDYKVTGVQTCALPICVVLLTIMMWVTRVCNTTRPAHIRAARRAVACARRSSVFTLANCASDWAGSIWDAYTQCRWGDVCRCGFVRILSTAPIHKRETRRFGR